MKKQLLLFKNTNMNVAKISQNQYLKAKKKTLKTENIFETLQNWTRTES